MKSKLKCLIGKNIHSTYCVHGTLKIFINDGEDFFFKRKSDGEKLRMIKFDGRSTKRNWHVLKVIQKFKTIFIKFKGNNFFN